MPKAGLTQALIDIEKIVNDVVVLKSGGLRKILLVSGINFDLKSEEEQNLILYSYQNFLNSLNFSVQQIVHTRKLNIDDYIVKLETIREQEPTELLKNIVDEYREFIRSFVAKNPIMSKTFFIVIPYDPVHLAAAGRAATRKVFGLFGKKQSEGAGPAEAAMQFEEDLKQLNLRVDQVIDGLNQVGLRAVPLEEGAIIELFYNFYNPTTVEKKGLAINEEKLAQ